MTPHKGIQAQVDELNNVELPHANGILYQNPCMRPVWVARYGEKAIQYWIDANHLAFAQEPQ